MTSTLSPKLRATPSARRPSSASSQSSSVAVVVDESATTDVESLLCAIGDGAASVTIIVTRHPIPPSVIGLGAGTEATLMWNECRTEWRTSVDATTDRLRTLTGALRQRGLDPVASIDSFPTWRVFRRLDQREIDGVVRTLQRLDADRIVVDPAHHLGARLHAAVAARGLPLATPSVSPARKETPSRHDDFASCWIDLGGSE